MAFFKMPIQYTFVVDFWLLVINQANFGEQLDPASLLEKTRYSAITWVQIPSRFGGYYSTRVIFESEL